MDEIVKSNMSKGRYNFWPRIAYYWGEMLSIIFFEIVPIIVITNMFTIILCSNTTTVVGLKALATNMVSTIL